MSSPKRRLDPAGKISGTKAFILTFFPTLLLTAAANSTGISGAVPVVMLFVFLGLLHNALLGDRWFAIGHSACDTWLMFVFFGIPGLAIGKEIGRAIWASCQ